MSIGIDAVRDELSLKGQVDLPAADVLERAQLWEDLLTLLVDKDSVKVSERARKRRLLSFLLQRADVDEKRFWTLGRAQRGRLFLSKYSRLSREIPSLEITSFDLDKLFKERFRNEPLTLGAAWHYGFWRSYFSHAAITHPANDGLREEFSTAWNLVRKSPVVLFRSNGSRILSELRLVRLDLPMVVGPLPYSDGVTLELAYLKGMSRGDPVRNHRSESLLIVPVDAVLAHDAFDPYLEHVVPRLSDAHLEQLANGDAEGKRIERLLRLVRVAEIAVQRFEEHHARLLLEKSPQVLLSVFLRNGPHFLDEIERAVRTDGVAVVHYHTGAEKSYRLTPRIDQFLKAKRIRARVQLLSAGGDTDTHASAATVYEAVLLGANGGAMTHAAVLALVPELADVYHGADPSPIVEGLKQRDPAALEQLATHTLVCWQHSILDFLSCMGIDDIQKTSGNTMAITMTKDWVREVDLLATADFGRLNAGINRERVALEPVSRAVRDRFRVSALLEELESDLPLVHVARILAHEDANWHLANSNRNLNADFLEVIYRMAAGQMPGEDDFFIESDMGSFALDAIGLNLSRESLRWALERLRADPRLLDYISLAVPRGFSRPGAAAANARVQVLAEGGERPVHSFTAGGEGEFEEILAAGHAIENELSGDQPLVLAALDPDGNESRVELVANGHGAHGATVLRASRDGRVLLKKDPRGGHRLWGLGVREPIWGGPVNHASISLGAASPDFLLARIEGNVGLSMVSSGEGGPIRLDDDAAMKWESMQAASGHFGIHARDLRRVRDVEIKINQGAKPGKGGRLSGVKVTQTVSEARNIPVGTDALSPDPKHDIYSIEDMPAEVWLWLLYHNHVGIKITGSNYTKYVAAGMWSNFVVDYLLIDSGLGGSGNYHADSSHVGWPDIFRTILHTHHALLQERVDLDGSGVLKPIRDLNGAPLRAGGGTRLFASGGLRGELDMLKVLIAGADALVEASIGKAVAFGCNQCGNCHLDCPRGGITTKHELTHQNDRDLMRRRFRNWTVLNMVKLAVLIDALNREHGALDDDGKVIQPQLLIDDIRLLRGRTDLLSMPAHDPPADTRPAPAEHDSCRVGSLAVSEPVTVRAIHQSAVCSYNGGNNRGGGIDFAGFAPPAVAEKTCLIFNTIGPDRVDSMKQMLGHLLGCRFFDALGREIAGTEVAARLDEFRIPVRAKYQDDQGWRRANLRESPGDFHLFFVELRPDVLCRYGATLLASEHWLQRQTKYGDLSEAMLRKALEVCGGGGDSMEPLLSLTKGDSARAGRLHEFCVDVKEEYLSVLAHLLDSRYYRTAAPDGAPEGKYAIKRRGFLVSMGEDLGAIKISGWTHTIPEYFEFERFWSRYPGARESGGIEVTHKGRTFLTQELYAHVWGMHHRYPTNSPAIDVEGRGNPAGAHPFKSYNLLLMHNGEQVGVDSTTFFLTEFGYVHVDPSMGAGADLYEGDSIYERKALTDTEYAVYLVDFTRRVLGLDTEEATQVISPITGLDLASMDETRRKKLELLMNNYVQLTPTGPYKFTIVESRRVGGRRRVGFRENMDIKFLRPHEIIASVDEGPGGVQAVANGSEAKIADRMLSELRREQVLRDSAADLRFNMRPGGNPRRREFGGVVEVFTGRGEGRVEIHNRFGEPVEVERAGTRADLEVPVQRAAESASSDWKQRVYGWINSVRDETARVAAGSSARILSPDDPLPAALAEMVDETLSRVGKLSFDDYRYLVEHALLMFAREGEGARAAALRALTELRKRLMFAELGGKSLASLEYITDGGRDTQGRAEGGIGRILEEVPALHEVLAWPSSGPVRYAKLTASTRDDLLPPSDAGRDVLVVQFRGFASESYQMDSASRIVSEAVRLGWRHLIGYDFVGGPRYVATNLAEPSGRAARGVILELYGREFGDFIGALLEGARIYVYGQAQSHTGMKADCGDLFVLQDSLNTTMYAAHGGTINVWDTGSRFAVAGQNKIKLEDGSPAPGFKSIHFGSPNEYAFEYLMSGGDNSLHVVMGLHKPDRRGELSLRAKPYFGKFFMSGAAAGRVYVFDPRGSLDPRQYHGNGVQEMTAREWRDDLAPFVALQARRRGLPLRIDGDDLELKLEGSWQRFRFAESFRKIVPNKVLEAAAKKKVASPSASAVSLV